MRVLTFKHGIHPPDEKAATSGETIQTILPEPGSLMVYPMIQHLGAPCEPLVSAGDRVLLGQKIGDSAAVVSSPVHASVSGIVKEIRDTLTPTGITCKAVIVENDGEYAEHEALRGSARDMDHIPAREGLLKIIREAGIVGLGGAGFPAHIKLNPPPDKKVNTIIVNAVECEPYLTTDHRVLLEETERIIGGLEIMLRLIPGAKGIIAIETNKQDAIEKMYELCKHKENIEVVGLVTKYPQGSEKQLIYACTNREVPSGGLPADVGCIVNNVDTVIAIERAVLRGRPLMRKVITITGGAVASPGNYKVRLGMLYGDLIKAVGGFKTEPVKMISGGPMMGVAMFSMEVPIIKTSSGFICLTAEEAETPPEKNCIRCGKCVETCPMGLMPLELNQNVIRGEMDLFIKNSGLDCIECGSCSYVCPAKRHLSQSIRVARRDQLAKRR